MKYFFILLSFVCILSAQDKKDEFNNNLIDQIKKDIKEDQNKKSAIYIRQLETQAAQQAWPLSQRPVSTDRQSLHFLCSLWRQQEGRDAQQWMGLGLLL